MCSACTKIVAKSLVLCEVSSDMVYRFLKEIEKWLPLMAVLGSTPCLCCSLSHAISFISQSFLAM